MSETDKQVRTLYCTCCGEQFKGRQFHNQDTGYGMGPCCADWVMNRRPFGHDPMTLEEFERCYGKRGYNFDFCTMSDTGSVSPMILGAFWIVPAVWLLMHFAVLQVVASFGR